MTVKQHDRLDHLVRRLQVAALAITALGDTEQHQAVEELLDDVTLDLRELADSGAPS